MCGTFGLGYGTYFEKAFKWEGDFGWCVLLEETRQRGTIVPREHHLSTSEHVCESCPHELRQGGRVVGRG